MRAQFFVFFLLFVVVFVEKSYQILKDDKNDGGLDYYDDYGDEDTVDLDSGGMDFVAKGKNQIKTMKKKTSHLSIVYNRLAHLTRITSAISLQSAAIRKSVLVRDVVTELLRAPKKNLESLTRIPLNETISELQKRLYDSQEIQNFREEMENLNQKKEILELMNSSISYLNGQQIDHAKMDEFFKSLEKSGNFLKTALACDEKVLDPVIDFSNDENLDNLNPLKSKIQDIQKCLKSLEFYKSNTSKIHDQFQQFIKLSDAKEGIQSFNRLQEEAKNFSKTIIQVKTLFEETSKFWNLKTPIGAIFLSALKDMKQILNPENSPELSLTLGFPDTGDMAKVSKDLRSDWFREKVARNHSIKELQTELSGFFKFGGKMKVLEENWILMKTNFVNSETNISSLAKDLKKLEGFNVGGVDLTIAEESRKIFENKWKDFDKIPNQDFEDLNKILSEVEKIMEGLNSIQNSVEEIHQKTEKVAIDSFLEDLISHDRVENMRHSESFKELGKRFLRLKNSQNQLKTLLNSRKSANQAKTRLLIETLQNSKLKSNLENLRNEKNFQPEVVLKMFEFSKLVFNIADKKSYFNQTKIFLENLRLTKTNLDDVENFVKGIKSDHEKSHQGSDHDNPILKLDHSKEMALSLGRGMSVLRQMVKALHSKRRLLRASRSPEDVNLKILNFNPEESVKVFWKTKNETIGKLLEELRILNENAKKVQDSSPMEMRKLLDEATAVHGFSNVFAPIHKQFSEGNLFKRQTENFKKLAELDLDFASHKGYLHAASLSFDELKTYFDEVFDLDHKRHSHHEVEHNYLPAVFICIAIFILIIICLFIAYGFTPSGRRKYVHFYLYYFGKPEAFEKRWRYSFFMDRQDGKNCLLDAAREINPTNLRKALKKGAYINAFNKFGNTSLHLATKRGHPEIVEILIKNGADRELLNAYNKTPEQMIPENYRKTHPEKIERFKRIEMIYEKFRKKKFRHRVPYDFPLTSYHIYIDDRTDDKVTDNFTLKFQSITTDETTPTTTHFIVRTEQDGVFATDSLEILLWIMSGLIIIKDTWMSACLKDEKQISNEWGYLVEKIRYQGVVYDTVPQWQKSMAKWSIPYLCGVYVAVVITEYPNLLALASIVTTHGGVMCENFPEKQNFNQGFRPCLHADTGPFFLIHDGKLDLDVYKNDPDRMYTLMTEAEFVHFMLGRKIKRNKNPNPTPALNDLED